MKTAVIIHGYNDKSEYLDESRPAASNDHWIPWIQRELLLKGVGAQAPEMPGFYEPTYEKWKEMLERFTPDENTILVGHSCGGGFLVRWLSENDVKVGKVVLVAPWLDPEKSAVPDFFNFDIDANLADKTQGVTIMYSTDDFPDIIKTIDTLKSKLEKVNFREFKGKGHFVLKSMKTDKFPELLEEVLG
ncbi:MAG: alpha/beta fold hydrolase [Candidatus Paceibacterota bacterium]